MSMKGLYQECKVGFIFSELFTLKMARKMVMITLYAKQKKRHRCTEDFWTLWEKMRVGCFERTASKYVYYLG